jgi:hypothetical protein
VAALDDEEVAALNLCHHAREGVVDEGVEGGVADEVVRYVDLKTLVRRDWRSDGVEEVGKCWEGAGAQLTTCRC